MRFFLIVTFVFCSFVYVSTSRADESPQCYQFEKEDSPERSVVTTLRLETWCYQKLSHPYAHNFIFNVDDNVVKPELAFLVTENDEIIHASLLSGDLTVHKVDGKDFNPISIPLQPPAMETSFSLQDQELLESASKSLIFLLNSPKTVHSLSMTPEMALQDSARASRLPWRGYWWSQKRKKLWDGPNSPLAKYDRLVLAQTGKNPGTVNWERARHNGTYSWTGHCNGWAASSVLRPEPKIARTIGGITFHVSDQKGLLAAVDYCVDMVMFGKRYNGTGNRRDIVPSLFHQTLTYYIGKLKKPVAFDYRSDSIVYNNVISGYRMTMTPTGPNTFNVTAILTVHKYDGGIYESPGIAPTYERIYKYTLTVDPSGKPIGGKWLSSNPDFLWVPLSPADCPAKDHNITENWIRKIIYE